MTPEVEQLLEKCWHRGDSVRDARVCVRTVLKVRLTFHEIHPVFVRMSHAYVPETAEPQETAV